MDRIHNRAQCGILARSFMGNVPPKGETGHAMTVHSITPSVEVLRRKFQGRTRPPEPATLALIQAAMMLEHYLDDKQMQEDIPWQEAAQYLLHGIRRELEKELLSSS